ncbi:MAG TPA: alanine--glyoxylate aminotransferase family protein [Patescibacteria group bacterium]|nr:alanine--glyoxylate aminotransferase family protein [Patescibacteria group bacterium]
MKDRTLLMIPGPIEFEPEVLSALGAPTASHVDPEFIEAFGKSLERMREVWLSPAGQPFVIAGSGTLAMDIPAANLIEPGDNALVLSTGYFGDRYAEILARYGAKVTTVSAEPGGMVDFDRIEAELKKGSFKLLTFTHVDTSTAVRVEPETIGKLGKKYGVLTILDGVCSVAGEEIRQDEWGIDVVLTASQKAVGVPPGLALLVAGTKAIETWKSRKTPVLNYYGDWKNWLPIMEAYESRKPSYFATPPVNLIFALNVSLGHIISEGMAARFARHKKIGQACHAAIQALGLDMVPKDIRFAASTLSAPRYPNGVNGPDLLPKIKSAGVVLAGGLHSAIKNEYFRIGHMGAIKAGDVLAAVGAIEIGLSACGYQFEKGAGVAAAQRIFLS